MRIAKRMEISGPNGSESRTVQRELKMLVKYPFHLRVLGSDAKGRD
jgi:hypothetical protein